MPRVPVQGGALRTDDLHDAVEAARGRSLHRAGLAVVIRDAVALHLVRSPHYLPVHQSAVVQAAERVRQQAISRRPELLRAEFRRRLEAGSRQALAAVMDEPIARWLDLDSRGALVRAGMEGMFRRMREAVRRQPAQVWHVPPGLRLLISDSPAVPYRLTGGLAAGRVGVARSDVIVMPLAMDCLVAIGPRATDADTEMTPAQVSFINGLQVRMAYRHV